MENEALVADLVSWIARKPRPYHQVMEAWRTSCPRLSIWEDTVDAGFVERDTAPDKEQTIRITDEGKAFLERVASTRRC